jgi:hypothetical protein
VKAEDSIARPNEFFVTEQSLPANTPAEEILSRLRDTRMTGQLTYHFVEGGIRNIMLTRKTKVSSLRENKTRIYSRRT